MNNPLTAVSRELLDHEPSVALELLADEVGALHRRMHPADVLVIEAKEGSLAMGRHEVPALAMLFRHHAADPPTTEVALSRAAAYLTTGRLKRG
jgi:hypothetical protein